MGDFLNNFNQNRSIYREDLAKAICTLGFSDKEFPMYSDYDEMIEEAEVYKNLFK